MSGIDPELLAGGRDLAEVAGAAAEAGARTALADWHRRDELSVRAKVDADDLVTEADERAQQAILAVLTARRPHDAVCGEEGPVEWLADSTSARVEWWVDPIDGTTSFVYGRADWAVSVAAVERSSGLILAAAVAEPVLDVLTTAALGSGAWQRGRRLSVRDTRELERALVEVNLGRPEQRRDVASTVAALVPAVRDIRRSGSAAGALAGLASGRADAAWLPGLRAWDGAGGMLIAAEAGATVGDLAGATPARWPADGDVLAACPTIFDELRGHLNH